jgi:hypothetical protein
MLLLVFGFLDLRSVDLVPVAETRGLVVLRSSVLANQAKPPACHPAEPDDRQGVGPGPTLEGKQSITRAFLKYVTTLCPLIGFREAWEGEGRDDARA